MIRTDHERNFINANTRLAHQHWILFSKNQLNTKPCAPDTNSLDSLIIYMTSSRLLCPQALIPTVSHYLLRDFSHESLTQSRYINSKSHENPEQDSRV